MMFEKKITQFEKEVLLQQKVEQLESELKEFSELQKKVYSERLQKVSWVWKIEFNESKKCFIQPKKLSEGYSFSNKKRRRSVSTPFNLYNLKYYETLVIVVVSA